jgi:hypothetical protein
MLKFGKYEAISHEGLKVNCQNVSLNLVQDLTLQVATSKTRFKTIFARYFHMQRPKVKLRNSLF